MQQIIVIWERTKSNGGSALLLQTDLKASTRVEMEKICTALWNDTICIDGNLDPADVPLCACPCVPESSALQWCSHSVSLLRWSVSCMWSFCALDQFLCLRPASIQITNALAKNIAKCFKYLIFTGIESSRQNLWSVYFVRTISFDEEIIM